MSPIGKNPDAGSERQPVEELLNKELPARPARRAAGYVRVSTEEQGQGWSLTGQEEQIATYAKRNDFEVVEVYRDESSGSGEQRPGLDRLLGDAQSGHFDAIVVVHTSRLFRNVALARRYKDLLRKKIGVEVLSVNQPILDPDDPSSFLLEGINELFDEYYLHQLRFWTKMGKRTRARKGLWNGTLPFGYEGVKKGVPVPHPENAKGLKLAYVAYSTGRYSDHGIAELLNRKGYRTTGNWGSRPFTKDTVRPMLQNIFYLGLTKYKEQTLPGEHEPLIDRELFDRCQEVRRQRRPKSRSLGRKQRVYMLSGLATCRVCGLALRCQASRKGNQYCYYRHTAVDRGHACTAPGKMIQARALEEQWSQIVRDIRLPEDWRQRIEELVGDANERASMLSEQASIEEKLRRLAQLYQDMIIDDDEYTAARDSLQRRLSMLAIPDKKEVIEAADYLQDPDKLWKAATPSEKQSLSRVLVGIIAVDVVNEAIVGLHPQRPFAVLLREVCGERLVLQAVGL